MHSNNYIKLASFVVFVLILLISAFNAAYTVDDGERAVILRNGAVIGTADPGLHWKWPFINDVYPFSIRSHAVPFDNLPMQSNDQQVASVSFTVSYHILPDGVDDVYRTYGSEEAMKEVLITRAAMSKPKNIFGQFTAEAAIQQRARLESDIQTDMQRTVVGPVVVDSVQLESVNFSADYNNSIEERMLAEVGVETEQQNLEKERVTAEKAVVTAQGEADSFLAKETANAEAIRLNGDAEAAAIAAKGAALRDNPELVALIQAERWNGVLPATMIPSSTLPVIGMQSGQ
jgi:regulator of protease activity HflC (stomatin/prohibitin superfamily)